MTRDYPAMVADAAELATTERVLAWFGSAADALDSAVAQSRIEDRNMRHGDEPIAIRSGVSVGAVSMEGGDEGLLESRAQGRMVAGPAEVRPITVVCRSGARASRSSRRCRGRRCG